MPRFALMAGLTLVFGTQTPRLQAQAGVVILVRHAEKADTTADPALSAPGVTRARALARALAEFPLDAIYVTEYRRTRLTAEPIAVSRGMAPISIPVRRDPAGQAVAVRDAVRHLPRGAAALLIGHSNTLPAIISALGGPHISDLCDAEYSTLFVLYLPGPTAPARLLRTTFGPPNPADAAGCLNRMQLD